MARKMCIAEEWTCAEPGDLRRAFGGHGGENQKHADDGYGD